MKKLFLFLFIPLFFVSCTNQSPKQSENSDASSESVIAEVNIHDLLADSEAFLGKSVSIKGTVDHVCEHGGQRMFVIETASEGRVKVTPNENIAAFKTDLEGQSIKLIGIVEEQRIDEDYLKEWEEEIMADVDMGDDKGEGSHLGGNTEKGGSDADIDEEMEKVNKLRQKIAESGRGYLAYYSVLCSEYEVMDMEEEPIEE